METPNTPLSATTASASYIGASRTINFDLKVEIGQDILNQLKGNDAKIVQETIGILNSNEIDELAKAYLTKTYVKVVINGRSITFEQDPPCDEGFFAMTNFEENGFHLMCLAFYDKKQLITTLLHELYRLYHSKHKAKGRSQANGKSDTAAAQIFSEAIYERIFKV